MDDFKYQIMRKTYGGCWCVDCRSRVSKKAERRRARTQLKANLRRETKKNDTSERLKG